jgi:DNA-binding transcriptional MerR regulator
VAQRNKQPSDKRRAGTGNRVTRGAGQRGSTRFCATVNGLARAAAVPAHVVRYYVRIGLLQPGRDPASGYRLFTAVHLTRLNFIRNAKRLGYTLSEIRHILHDAGRGVSPCPAVRDIIHRRVRENAQRLREISTLQRRMERAVRMWRKLPDGVPDGDSVCYLIESFAKSSRNNPPRHA